MARIRHIALVTDDPAKTAEFYKNQFGLTELYRRPTDSGKDGVWLSDGYIYFAILKYGEPGAPKLGEGQKSDLRGLHHIGFYVDDEKEAAKSLESVGFGPIPMGYPEGEARPMRGEGPGGINLKYYGPDAVQIDIRSSGWNEVIELGMDRLELQPVKAEAAE
jgi:catechol 2,3-dioxygenase-like lactoylglutathione lyase family enzyme